MSDSRASNLAALPSHLIVLGGGYVEVEFAQAFGRFGSQVTVLEFGTQLLGRENPDVAAAVLTIFEEDGIGKVRSTRDRLIPYCAFIDPELARVGLDETTAQRQRIAVRVARIPMTSVLRARAIGETRGFILMLLDAESDRILGFTMLGAEAGEVACCRADGDARRTALHRTSRCDPHTPDDGRRSQCAAHECPSEGERNDGGPRPGALGR
jgi:pyruvate/2-oxoglutarate dehydrogenase complex dihydrolipoamide dehydrogenase (E3) component